MPDKIEFIASFPPIQSAIKVTGDGNGARIQLDIPEIEIIQAMHLIAMRGMALKVTIEELETTQNNGTRTTSRRSAKQRK